MNSVYVEEFKDCSDEQLALMAQGGDFKAEEALIARALPMVGNLSKTYYSPDGSVDGKDFFQTALLGVVDAIHAFDSKKGTAFMTFAATCVRNKLYHFYRKISDKEAKLVGLESAELLENSATAAAFDMADENAPEMYLRIKKALASLEWKVWWLHYNGYKTREIATLLGISEKSAQNALNRANRKLKKLFENK